MPGIFDVSMFVSEHIPVFPGDPKTKIEKIKNITEDGYELSKITTGVHIGTHIDAPSHFFQDRIDASELDLNTLVGKAVVIEFPNSGLISVSDLKSIDFSQHTRVIFKTQNSALMNTEIFNENYVYLDEQAADYLIEQEIKLVGFDYYTLDKYNSDMPVHKKLLENDVVIIEGLNLCQIDPGEYELLALPIKLKAEAAPARVILRRYFRGEIPE